MTNDLIFSVENHIGLITLNRQQALNALTHEMILALSQQLTCWERDQHIHAIVIQAAEGRAFCAGGDIRTLYQHGMQNPKASLAFFNDEYHLNHQIYTLKKPYIALMDGFTFGGGVGISLHGKYPIASERFIFAMPETSIGFFPDIGASHVLSQSMEAYGLYLGLTGARADCQLAHALGLVHTIISSTKFPALLTELIQMDWSNNNSHQAIESCLNAYQEPLHTPYFFEFLDTINRCFKEPKDMTDIISRLTSETNPFAKETLQTLLQKSPTSLCVTLEQFKRAKNKTLAECLQMDYALTYHFMQHADFYEGVRALLIDKDKSPQWTPKTVQEITFKRIDSFFEPLPKEVVSLELNH